MRRRIDVGFLQLSVIFNLMIIPNSCRDFLITYQTHHIQFDSSCDFPYLIYSFSSITLVLLYQTRQDLLFFPRLRKHWFARIQISTEDWSLLLSLDDDRLHEHDQETTIVSQHTTVTIAFGNKVWVFNWGQRSRRDIFLGLKNNKRTSGFNFVVGSRFERY